MRFNTAEEMYEYLNSGRDLYHPGSEIYVFPYNDKGTLCTYHLSKDRVKEISKQSKQNHEHLEAFLGSGGEILEDDEFSINPSLEFCKEHYQEPDWLNTEDINLEEPDCYLLCCLDDEDYDSAQYFTFSSMKEAKEFCYQFAKQHYSDEDLKFEEDRFYHKNGHEAARIDYIYGNCFEVNYIFPIHMKENETSFCIWHHAYDGVRFEIRKSGSYEECCRFAKNDFHKTYEKLSEVSPDQVKRYEDEEKNQWMLDDGLEWEIWDIVTVKKSINGENLRKEWN